MIWLILSIACSSLIFVVFRLFGRWGVDNLPAIVVNYGVAAGLGFALTANESPLPYILQQPWKWSVLLLGFIFIALFQVMAVISQRMGVSAVSIAVKMSLAIPVVFGIWYFNESAPLLKIIGIGLALLAVYLATAPRQKLKLPRREIFWLVVLFTGSGFIDAFLNYNQKVLVAPPDQLLFTSALFAAAGIFGLIILVVKGYHRIKLRWKLTLFSGLLLGIPNLGSIYFLIKALHQPQLESSLLFPVNHVGIVLLSTLLGTTLFAERLSTRNKAGLALAVVAIVLMTAWK